MILLPTPRPTSTAGLVATVRALLAQAVAAPDGAVNATGDFPAITALTIDLTRATPQARPAAQWLDSAGPVVGKFTVDSLSITGHPFGDASRPVDVDVTARACRAEFVDAGGGKTGLRLAGATDGHLRASISKSAVETILRTQASQQAKAQGVDLKEVHVAWQTNGPRDLSADVTIKAKKGFFPTATIRVRGNVRVDEALTARLSGLSVDGEGMVGSVAAGFLRPKLTEMEGKTLSLLALPLDGIKVKDVRLVATADRLSVEGEFGE